MEKVIITGDTDVEALIRRLVLEGAANFVVTQETGNITLEATDDPELRKTPLPEAMSPKVITRDEFPDIISKDQPKFKDSQSRYYNPKKGGGQKRKQRGLK